MADDDHGVGYSGTATLVVGGREVAVRAVLDARHEPYDGRLHWFGRVVLPEGATPELARDLVPAAARVELHTEGGSAEARIGDVDPWGRYRVTGVGLPPYPLADPPLDQEGPEQLRP